MRSENVLMCSNISVISEVGLSRFLFFNFNILSTSGLKEINFERANCLTETGIRNKYCDASNVYAPSFFYFFYFTFYIYLGYFFLLISLLIYSTEVMYISIHIVQRYESLSILWT